MILPLFHRKCTAKLAGTHQQILIQKLQLHLFFGPQDVRCIQVGPDELSFWSMRLKFCKRSKKIVENSFKFIPIGLLLIVKVIEYPQVREIFLISMADLRKTYSN